MGKPFNAEATVPVSHFDPEFNNTTIAPDPPAGAWHDRVGASGVAAQTKRKILCIEDDRETAALIAEALAERGYEVVLAYNGGEGFAAIFKTMPDLILCDINLPVMSGFEVLENLTKVAPRFGNMPFLFLTALADRRSELKGRRLGADDYVTKPIDFDILDAILKARLAHIARTDVWAGDVQLNDREIETLTWVDAARHHSKSQRFST